MAITVVLAQNMQQQLQTNAVLAHGKAEQSKLTKDVLNITEEIPVKDLTSLIPTAVLVLNPQGPDAQRTFAGYKDQYKKEEKVGVAKLVDSQTLYVVPPTSTGVQEWLKTFGVPNLPGHTLCGIIARQPLPKAPAESKADAVVLAQSDQRIQANAVLVCGSDEQSRFSNGVLNVTDEIPLKDLTAVMPKAVYVLVNQGPDSFRTYSAYKDQSKKEEKVGIAKLDNSETLYVAPPAPPDVSKWLENHGAANLPGHSLIGIIA